MRRLISLAAALVFAALWTAGCESYVQQYHAKQEADRQALVHADRIRIWVYTSGITEPHDKLGDLAYTDPLNGETINTHHINGKLRDMAIARWGHQVDAIIHVATKVGGATTATITVTGEAVRIRGNCLECRHSFPEPPPPS